MGVINGQAVEMSPLDRVTECTTRPFSPCRVWVPG